MLICRTQDSYEILEIRYGQAKVRQSAPKPDGLTRQNLIVHGWSLKSDGFDMLNPDD